MASFYLNNMHSLSRLYDIEDTIASLYSALLINPCYKTKALQNKSLTCNHL